MYLANLKLWNFRKFGAAGAVDLTRPNLDLPFHKGLNLLIGENDSGKTAIIDAIKIVLKTHSYEFIKITEDDFYKGADELRIEILFRGFTDDEAAHFTEWLGWEGSGASAQAVLRVSYSVSKNGGRIRSSDVRAGVDNEPTLMDAQAREYLKATYLKPLRDAKSELVPKKNSRLSQIFQEHEAFKGKEDHDLVDLSNRFNKNIENYFAGTDHTGAPIADQLGKELKDSIDEYLQSFYDVTKQTKISAHRGDLAGILEKLELLIKDEVNIGLGTMNRLFMASELLHLNKKQWDGIRLALIEELEAHLHPQAQMQVVETLQKQQNVQLILSTHSPNLASKVKLENIILCCAGDAFPLGEVYTELDATGYSFLERFLDVTKSNLFFARGVIIVEGWSEEILLPALAKLLKRQGKIPKDLTEAGVSIVNVGNTGLLNYAKIFLRKIPPEIDLPVALVSDVDVRTYLEEVAVDPNNGKKSKTYDRIPDSTTIPQTQQAVWKKVKENTRQKVQVFVAPVWTLEYALYKSIAVSASFQQVTKAVHTDTDWDADFEMELAKKLINKGFNKLEVAYRLAAILENSGLDGNPLIDIEYKDTCNYLVDAIKYACNN